MRYRRLEEIEASIAASQASQRRVLTIFFVSHGIVIVMCLIKLIMLMGNN